MTTSDFRKMLKQLKNKPQKQEKYMRHNAPKTRTCGLAKKKCRMCNKVGAHINKYGLHYCRLCFKDVATKLGFKQYS